MLDKNPLKIEKQKKINAKKLYTIIIKKKKKKGKNLLSDLGVIAIEILFFVNIDKRLDFYK
jgi:hypothetical protein